MNTNVLPFMPLSKNAQNSPLSAVKPAVSELKFAGDAPAEAKQPKPTIYDDPMAFDFDVPVTPETVRQLKQGLLKLAATKEKVGGTVKVFISSPGGQVDAGNRIIDMITQLRAPVDTIVDGGTAASMGGFLFLAGDRRIMTPNARIMVHPPNVTLPGNVPFSEPDLMNMAKQINRTRIKGEHYIAKRTGLSKDEAHELMNTENYLDPLQALKLGFATHVLIEDGALTKASIQGLSDDEIEMRDIKQDYDGLEVFDFDPGLSDPRKIAALQAAQNPQMMQQMLRQQAQRAQGQPPAGKPEGPGQQEQPTVAAHAGDFEIIYPDAPKIDFNA